MEQVPGLPDVPDMPGAPDAPDVDDVPDIDELRGGALSPAVPGLDDVPLAQVSLSALQQDTPRSLDFVATPLPTQLSAYALEQRTQDDFRSPAGKVEPRAYALRQFCVHSLADRGALTFLDIAPLDRTRKARSPLRDRRFVFSQECRSDS